MTSLRLKAEDIAIMECLRADARMSVSDIAERVGMPISTVRHRLNRLIDEGLVEFSALANPLKLGYQIWAFFEIHTEIGRIEAVAGALSERPEVYFVGITTGRYDVFAAGVFRSNEHLLEFLTEHLSKIDGIVRTSTSSILKLVKRTMAFELRAPEEIGGKAKAAVPRKGVRPNTGVRANKRIVRKSSTDRPA
jgi:Lrp/AsnC family transcriptional regulator, regulator for asnA, asnC and gidA